MVGVGCVAGCLAAAIVARTLEAQLYGVATYDEWAIAESVAVLLVAAVAAGFWPARRAMRVNPVTALRAD